MAGTREKILDKALELFNEKGIEYVGMRELANALGMRIGNITYYFPTKDDLVFELSNQYTEVNSQVHATFPRESLYDFLKKQEQLFKNRLQYSALMRSMVHLVDQNKKIADRYREVQKMRKDDLGETIRFLNEKKFLAIKTEDESWFLASACSLILRFWLSEAALEREKSPDQFLGHYLKLLANLFKPYAGKKGLNDIARFLREIQE